IGSIEKMSKSRRNVVDPDEIVATYGADTARWFMLSDSPPERDVQWTEAGIEGASRFQQRIWRVVQDAVAVLPTPSETVHDDGDAAARDVRRLAHRAVRQIASDIEGLRFNRAVAQIYELANGLGKYLQELGDSPSAGRLSALREAVEILIQLLAPMMPHLAETCWEALGNSGLVADAPWPEADETLLVVDLIVLPVQVNGKRRGEISVPPGAPRELVEKEVLSLEAVARILEGKPPRKLVIVPDRIEIGRAHV